MFSRFQRPRRDPIGPHATRLLRANQPAVLQYIQVLGKRRQRHIEWLRQLTDRNGAAAQPFENGPSCRVRQGIKDAIELYGLVRHMPNYTVDGNLGQQSSTPKRACVSDES